MSAPPRPAPAALSGSNSASSSSSRSILPSSASVSALVGAGVGAAAASSLLVAWGWWQRRSQAAAAADAANTAADHTARATHEHTHEPRFARADAAPSAAGWSLALPPGSRAGRSSNGTGSPSRSRALRHDPESSVSRRLSDTGSYLADREYEGDHHTLAKTLTEEASDAGDDDAVTAALRHSQYHGDGQDDGGDLDQQPEIYMCPHCSNYINAHELIVPGGLDDDADSDSDGDEDEDAEGRAAVAFHRAQSAQAARILSAAEQLSIQQALRDSLHQIFVSVDEDRDGLISREEMAAFLKKLGLTGDREAAFLNIVGGDTFQALSSSERHAAAAASGSPLEPKSAGVQRGSGSGRASGSHSGSLSGASSAASASASAGPKVGINFRQFVARFQDTLEGMDQIEVTQQEDEQQAIATNPVTIDPSAQFQQQGSPKLAPQNAPQMARENSPFPEASLVLTTPPRGAAGTQLTVNTAGAAASGSVTAVVPAGAAPSAGSSLFSPTASPASASASALAAAASSPSIRVFLGGACGDTTWRKDDAIPLLVAHGISFYDPQVKDWSPKLVALEGLMKAWCKILLFVIGKQTRALASMIEVAALIASGRRVVLVIEPVEAGVEIEGQVPSASELKDLNRARSYLRDVAGNYSIPVHSSALDGIKAIIAMEEEEKRELKARLAFLRESSLLHTPSSSGGGAATSGGPNGSGGTGSNAGTPGHRPSYSMAGGAGGGRSRGRSSVMLNGSALALITNPGGGGGGGGGGSALSSPASASASASSGAAAGITPSHPHHSHSHGGHGHGHSGHKKMHSQQLHLHGMHHPPPMMMLQHAATLPQLHANSGGGSGSSSNGGGALHHSHSLSGAGAHAALTLTVPPRMRGDSVSSPSSASASAAAAAAEPRSGRVRYA